MLLSSESLTISDESPSSFGRSAMSRFNRGDPATSIHQKLQLCQFSSLVTNIYHHKELSSNDNLRIIFCDYNTIASIQGGIRRLMMQPGYGRPQFDGRRMRMPITRRTVDHSASMVKYLQERRTVEQSLSSDVYAALEPKPAYLSNVLFLITSSF